MHLYNRGHKIKGGRRLFPFLPPALLLLLLAPSQIICSNSTNTTNSGMPNITVEEDIVLPNETATVRAEASYPDDLFSYS